MCERLIFQNGIDFVLKQTLVTLQCDYVVILFGCFIFWVFLC